MYTIAETVRAGLVPFLLVTGGLLAVLVCYVVVLHGVGELAFRRRQRLIGVYRPLVDVALHAEASMTRFDRLRAAPRRHRPVIAALILEPLRIAEGSVTERARAAAGALGLVARWTAALGDRRWWIRADAALALGLVKSGPAVAPLISALDDPYDEVRAAAVEALGRIEDPAAISELITRLPEQSRHQRVRLVQALQQFGSAAVAPLLEDARSHHVDRVSIAELLGSIGAVSAIDQLIAWSNDDRPALRAAALGAIGVDERAYYHVLRRLGDDAEEVRAMAAWALGRSGRQEAAAYLAPRLNDEWVVAAQSARALRDLGAAGRQALEAAATDEHAELARQMLWECGATHHERFVTNVRQELSVTNVRHEPLVANVGQEVSRA